MIAEGTLERAWANAGRPAGSGWLWRKLRELATACFGALDPPVTLAGEEAANLWEGLDGWVAAP
jgi:hypothetical protein